MRMTKEILHSESFDLQHIKQIAEQEYNRDDYIWNFSEDKEKMKQCTKCKKWKNKNDFCRNIRKRDELDCWCKECKNQGGKIYREKHKESIKVQQSKYYSRPDIIEKRKQYDLNYYKKNKKKTQQYNKEYQWMLRQQSLFFYSNGEMKCQLCNNSDIDNLCIDHLNGDGKKHRQKVGWGVNVYRWLINNNFPSDFTILCKRCNRVKQDMPIDEFRNYIKKIDLNLNSIKWRNK